MTAPIANDNISLSAPDVEELQRAIESVLKPLSLEEIKKVHLKATHRWRVPVSFDDRWRPFLNWTKGYHHPRELRLYFDAVPRVLRVAETWFKSAQSPRSGGRVFIDERGIYCDGANWNFMPAWLRPAPPVAPGDASVRCPRWERCPQCPETLHYVDVYGTRSSNPPASHIIRGVYECPRRHRIRGP